MNEIEQQVREALHSIAQIAMFWGFVESEGLPAGNADEVNRALFAFLVGEEWFDSVNLA